MNLFIFAHQDDEFGVFWEIKKLIAAGKRVVVIYMTSGTLDGTFSVVRNNESINVLTKMGVSKNDIVFLGGEQKIPDGDLCFYLDLAYDRLIDSLSRFPLPSQVYTLAWEGGHQDHDACYALAIVLANKLNVLDKTFQFPLYTGLGTTSIIFRLFVNNPLNGKAIVSNIPFKERLIFLSYIFNYKSQLKTWLALYPFLVWHYFIKGTQILHFASTDRLFEPPHSGEMLYSRRKIYSFDKVKKCISAFVEKHLI